MKSQAKSKKLHVNKKEELPASGSSSYFLRPFLGPAPAFGIKVLCKDQAQCHKDHNECQGSIYKFFDGVVRHKVANDVQQIIKTHDPENTVRTFAPSF